MKTLQDLETIVGGNLTPLEQIQFMNLLNDSTDENGKNAFDLFKELTEEQKEPTKLAEIISKALES